MRAEPTSCDASSIEAFLAHRLAGEALEAFERHLDTCARCQAALGRRTADEDAWHKASCYLREDEHDVPAPCDSATDGVSALDSRGCSVEAEQVLRWLKPTDDPGKLGRIGPYEVSAVVGSGGMGVVLKAHDPSLDRVVAIKVLAPHLATSAAARHRFSREAKAAAAVLHPNVIAVHGVSIDEVGIAGDALPYLVMPYLRGPSLQRRIDNEGALPLADILRIATQIAAGLAAAHQQGLVHRDIKPANVLLADGVERVTITDFGLARAVDDASLTRSGVIAGTPLYMAPEQARGDTTDARSDLFSLGSVIYTMCTGRPPFRAETTFGLLQRIIHDSPRPIRELNPEIPAWLEELVQRLHAKSPSDRIQSAEHLAKLLEQCLAHVQTGNAPLPAELQPRRARWLWRAALPTALLLAGMLLLSRPPADTPASPPAATTTSPPTDPPSLAFADTELTELWHEEGTPSPAEIWEQARQLELETRDAFVPTR
ncbi:MAG: protein kinase [Planctomycetales bacterium]|nr:protein kinase [Planctomycetales bacterium]